MTQITNVNINRFLKKESTAGIILIGASVLAIILANSPLAHVYKLLINTPVAIQISTLVISKPLLLWVNDGLMTIFFFLIGLELKREFVDGQLSDRKNIILPALGAIGGMLIPVLIYVALNYNDPIALKGWAIPAATDIAFALAILSLLGSRVPISLKIFLTSLAIFDDVGGIIIIAFFYTIHLSITPFVIAALCVFTLFILNKRGTYAKSLYLTIGIIMWVSMLKSGVHATLSGIVMAMFIPIHTPLKPDQSPLKSLEHDLHATVAFIILPIFAFCNAGINLSKIGIPELTHNIPVGIALGLFVGKQVGVFFMCWLGIKLGFTKLPKDVSFGSLYGISVLSGIGFTMSLFISSLSFHETGVNLMFDEKIGIIIGSVLSAIVGYLVLNKSLPKQSLINTLS